MATGFNPPPAAPADAPRGLGVASLSLGFLGLAFAWLIPLGIVLSLAGLLTGLFGWLLGRAQGSGRLGMVLWGAALSAVGLALGLMLLPDSFTTWTVRLFSAGSP
jgi:hypothetical protein